MLSYQFIIYNLLRLCQFSSNYYILKMSNSVKSRIHFSLLIDRQIEALRSRYRRQILLIAFPPLVGLAAKRVGGG